MRADGKYNVTRSPVDEASPSWSPDGKQLLFHASSEEGQEEIYVMDADGSNVLRMTQGAEPARVR